MEDINLHLLDKQNDWQIVRRPTGIYVTGLTKHNIRVDAGKFSCNYERCGIIDKVPDIYLKRSIPQYVHHKLRMFWQNNLNNKYDNYMGEVLYDDIYYILDDILCGELKHLKFLLRVDSRPTVLKAMILKCDIIGQAYAAQPMIEKYGFTDWLDMWVVAFINSLKYEHYIGKVPADMKPHLLTTCEGVQT